MHSTQLPATDQSYFFEELIPWPKLEETVLLLPGESDQAAALPLLLELLAVTVQRYVWEMVPTAAAQTWQTRYNTDQSQPELLVALEKLVPAASTQLTQLFTTQLEIVGHLWKTSDPALAL